MLGQSLYQTEETSLGVEPSISSKLFLERFKTLDDTRHAEVVVTLGAIKRTNNEIDNTKVEDLFGRFFDCNSLFFLLDAFHQLFCIGVLTGHNIADTKVGQDNGSDGKQVIHLTTDKWLVVADRIAILVILHEEDVGYIEFPSFMFTAELG